ncbi:hypothetical protein [Salinispora arenicola]|uniref:hypothetical protein n=1 Tax=Salinispora arenicola TaxID=168697 RepID=UPI0016A98C5E|nr:hypothetical protein [Salinispora arenicola]NIL57075.1 hypothetical protein [Salinispora arenicola]NIL62704.1 hypothetical protein [Salinispora arenicola]
MRPVRRRNPVALLCEVADLLIEQNRLLGDIRDRLPEQPGSGRPEPAGIQEPAPQQIPVVRPESPPAPKPVSEPASSPAAKATPRKTGARRRT